MAVELFTFEVNNGITSLKSTIVICEDAAWKLGFERFAPTTPKCGECEYCLKMKINKIDWKKGF